MDKYLTFTGKIDRRNPRNQGDIKNPYMRENLLSRDGRLKQPDGTETLVSGLTDIVTWASVYYTVETGIVSPKTFAYTQDGKLWYIDIIGATATEVKAGLNTNAYPNHYIFQTGEQTRLFLVDGLNLYEYDGNNDNTFNKVDVLDSDDNPVNPIDLIGHKDRLCLISNKYMFVSKNLEPTVFDDSTDSIQLIIGEGKSSNLSFGKIEDFLFILNTEGIFRLTGDTISALASTFSIDLVEQRYIVASRSAKRSEKAIVFLAAQDESIELWSFDGNNTKLLSYNEKLTDYINPNREMLDKAIATYENFYYKLSFVEKGYTYNNLEVWYDSIEDKIEFVRGRNVSCYCQADSTRENYFSLIGRSDTEKIMWANRGRNFDGQGIKKRLITRFFTPSKGTNVRFTAIYPEIEPTGARNVFFRYLLDARLSDLDHKAEFNQDLSGEAKFLGVIRIANQAQFLDRVRPKINYSRGESIGFEIIDETKDLEFSMLGIGIDFIGKAKKKGKKVGK